MVVLSCLHRVDGDLTQANRNVTCSSRYEEKKNVTLDITQQSWPCHFMRNVLYLSKIKMMMMAAAAAVAQMMMTAEDG